MSVVMSIHISAPLNSKWTVLIIYGEISMILDILKRTGREVLILFRIIGNLAIVDENGPF